jgi:hypothetical protein
MSMGRRWGSGGGAQGAIAFSPNGLVIPEVRANGWGAGSISHADETGQVFAAMSA